MALHGHCRTCVLRPGFPTGLEPRDDFRGRLLNVAQGLFERLFTAPVQLDVVGAADRGVDAASQADGMRHRLGFRFPNLGRCFRPALGTLMQQLVSELVCQDSKSLIARQVGTNDDLPWS